MRSIVFILVCLVSLAVPVAIHAQIAQGAVPSLQLNPAFPEADEPYTVTLSGGTGSRASIQWFINGVENTAFKNNNSINLIGPGIADTTSIRSKITYTNGATALATHTVVPYRVDMLVSAHTLTPPFYQGRALPSSGSSMTITALVFNSVHTPSSHFSYLWKVNNKVQNGGALYGVNTLSYTPSFDTATQISVDIMNAQGEIVAARSIIVPIATPQIEFYEQNPLRGLSMNVLQDPYILTGDELTIRAEGYYMGEELALNSVEKKWQINGVDVQPNPDDADEITINKQGNSGRATLYYEVRNLAQLLQGATKKLIIQF